MSINVSLGTTKSRSESNSTKTVANASEVKAGGDVNVTSTKKDIDIIGSNVEGKDVTLNAKENLSITASKNTNKTEQNSKSSSASVGASLELGKGPSYSISGSMSKGEVSANGTTFNESNVTANKDLSFASGKDTNIKGGKLSGEKITGNVGNDLNIESKQDSNSYKENNKSVGASVGLGSNKAVSGSASVGKIDSKYESVIEQSGIYAGKEGFDIRVEANTDLKGGIISSTSDADKNKLSTGTLTFEDIQNKADYKACSIGFNVKHDGDKEKNEKIEKNERGVTPSIGMPASGEYESTTKAAISEGTIEIRDKENQKQDVNKLNRDTANSLNKLGEIFDKNTVKEKQEFAGLFQEFAHDYIGDLTGKIRQDEKAALNSFVDGLISAWTNGNFLAGASGTALLESMQNELEKIKDPALKQIVAGMMGALAGELVGGDAQVGASSAVSTEKYNEMMHKQVNAKMKLIDEIMSDSSLTKDEKMKKIEFVENIALVIYKSQQEVLAEFGYKHWYNVPADKVEFLMMESDMKAKKAIAFDLLKSVGVNLSTNIADLPLSLAKKSALGNGIWDMGNTVLNLNDDLKKYTGVDAIVAVGSDAALPIATVIYSLIKNKNNSNGDILNNSLSKMTVTVIGGVAVGVMNDKIVDHIKKRFAKTDEEKIYDKIYSVIKRGVS